jgi:hypothetical protein
MEHLTDSDISFLVDTAFVTTSLTYEDGTRAVLVARPTTSEWGASSRRYVLVDTETMTTALCDELHLTHKGELLLVVDTTIVQVTQPVASVFVLEN